MIFPSISPVPCTARFRGFAEPLSGHHRQVSAQQQDLEQQLHKAKERYERIDENLQLYSQSCNLVFDMYAAVSYDRYIVEELQQQQKRQKEEEKQIQEEQNKCRIELGILGKIK